MYVCGKVFRQMKHCLSALHHPAFNLTHGGTGSKRMTFAGVSRAGRDRLEEALGIEGSARPRFAPCALKVGWERKKGGANSCGRKQIISKWMRRAHSFLWFRTLWEGGGEGGCPIVTNPFHPSGASTERFCIRSCTCDQEERLSPS